ncbi:unnamed protein product, partial [marine sediment metagenome]
EKGIKEVSEEVRRTVRLVTEEIDKSSSKIIAVMFSESRKIREDIGYQAIILKTLQDNLSEIRFDGDIGISSKIEVSVGAEILGTGAKWILDIDTAKASYREILKAIQLPPWIPNEIKQRAKSKIQKMLQTG